jgi:hypothetical protein
MRQITDKWIPEENVLDHSGKPLVTGRNFFVSPPPEIGTVLSAYSALKVGQSSYPARTRLMITLIVALCFTAFSFYVFASRHPTELLTILVNGTIVGAFLAIPAAIVTFAILYLFRRDYRCDYVGTAGVASYHLLDVRRGIPGKYLLFQDATDLKITLTPQHITGIGAATAYRYSWVNANNQEIFFLSGKYNTKKKVQEDRFHLATAAEAACGEYQRALRLALASDTAS